MKAHRRDYRKSFWILFFGLFCFGIIPAVLFGVLQEWIYLMRPVFNIDYLIIGAFAGLLPTFMTGALLGICFINDLLYNLAPIYHFQITDVFFSLTDLQHLDLRAMTPLFGITVMGVVGYVFFVSRVLVPSVRRIRGRMFATLTLSAVFVSGLDILNGTSFLPLAISRSFLNVNIAYSGARSTFKAFREASVGEMQWTPLTSEQSAVKKSGFAREVNQGEAKENLVLVLVESLGLFKNDAVNLQLRDVLQSDELKSFYRIDFGTVPFHGHTIQGEFRELCGAQLVQMGKGAFPECLPASLKSQGYRTLGLHGFTNQFYRRYQWYPKLQFDEALLAEDLRRLGLQSTCGSGFTGLCDREIIQWFGSRLKESSVQPYFVYHLTLNSHHPVAKDAIVNSRIECGPGSPLEDFPAVCHHNQVLGDLLESIANLAVELKATPLARSTRFLIVGDHSPPFLRTEERALFEEQQVPFILLTPD